MEDFFDTEPPLQARQMLIVSRPQIKLFFMFLIYPKMIGPQNVVERAKSPNHAAGHCSMVFIHPQVSILPDVATSVARSADKFDIPPQIALTNRVLLFE